MAYKKFTKSVTQLQPDPRYGSKLVSKFVNCLMLAGKKTRALRVFYDAMDIIEKRMPEVPPNEVFEAAMNNVRPNIEVRGRRVGGSNYQVPMQVNRKRQQSLAIRWVIQCVRKARTNKPTSFYLAQEIMGAYKKEGGAMTIRDNMHRMADANKAFAHFAW